MTLTVLLLVFHISGAACAVNAVMNARTDQRALAWAISLLTIPFVAVPADLFFGRSKFEGFVEAYEERATEIDCLRTQYRAELEPFPRRRPRPALARRSDRKGQLGFARPGAL